MRDDIIFDDRAVVVDGALIISDIHLGLTDVEGADFPTGEYNDIIEEIENLLLRHDPDTVVIAGDVFHRFDNPPEKAREAFQKITSLVSTYNADLFITPGNHDNYMFNSEAFFDGQSTQVYEGRGLAVFHGHEDVHISEDVDLCIVGHIHPSVEIQSMKRPAFLFCERAYKGKDVLVLPPFSKMPSGTPVYSGMSLSVDAPFIETGKSIGEYEVIVWDEEKGEELIFPRLRELDQYLG